MSYLFSCRKTFSLLFFTLITNLNNDHSPFLIIFVRRSPPLLLISVCWPHLFIFVSSSLSIDLCPYQVFISCLHFEETLKNKNKNNLSSPIKGVFGSLFELKQFILTMENKYDEVKNSWV
ncbi:hypothetical protein ES319_A01G176500v1 [Gossypium barbadense]|uniref:Uncharacterized protein n=3 Tax=Gossypium TaxID=3633 RepID=A0A5J5WY78_GOSBA|nr:hypothetical protein ES319_A01G176500v1 [Gossypium barbadense]TYH31691.1 hypothetical protein ES288_A01G192400v1 [Gossypium darwinii]TYI43870.1 hypothetical protein ES332_A01G198000v1 [Gossypium tomentosum]